VEADQPTQALITSGPTNGVRSTPTLTILAGWRAFQAAEFSAVGVTNHDRWVFTDGDGQPVHPHAVYEAFRRIVHNAGIPAIRFMICATRTGAC
jgi:hypothetical protein